MTLPIRFEDFAERGKLPWLDRGDAAAAIAAQAAASLVTDAQAELLRLWDERGWVVLDCRVDDEVVDAVNIAVDKLIQSHDPAEFETWKIKLQNMHERSSAVRTAILNAGILRWCQRILGMACRPFQTLNMPIGSQIPPHTDQILMSTHPAGYMLAAWIALEDVAPDAGPLLLWSGSHRLPYLSARQVGIPRDAPEAECSQIYAERYYEANRQRMIDHGLEPYEFLAKKGQVLLWHSNIVHGGARITRPDSTRRSLIVHYFGAEVHHYSDLFHRPSKLPELEMGEAAQ